ncbi:piggyBac transposable element-derived protein 2 [Trichonephila clavipes]|nr:piggyBac transposable element-derived protein 2 [Trichonephila clavipes]
MERKASWTKDKPSYTVNEVGNLSSENLESISNILGNKNSLEIFEEFSTPEFYEYLINEPERYAKEWENKPEYSVTIDELKSFIGFLIFSGYHTLTSECDYCTKDEDLMILIVKNSTVPKSIFRN